MPIYSFRPASEVPPLAWLESLEPAFKRMGQGGCDLYYLMHEGLGQQRLSFSALMRDASNGSGYTLDEGIYFCLDQDAEDPAEFNKVVFFIGDMEHSTLSVAAFVELMRLAVEAYSRLFPESAQAVIDYLGRLEKRYAKHLG